MKFDKFDYIFIVLLLYTTFISFSLVSTLKQIPSPIYGGDYYNGLGGVIHILDGGNVLDSAQMLGQIPWVPWLYHFSVAVFSKITGLDAINSLLYFSIPIQIFSVILLYLFAYKLTGKKYLGLILIPLLLAIGTFPTFKYSDFASILIIPLFLFSFLIFIRNQNLKNAIISGIILGLVGLSNSQAFFDGFIFLGFSAIIFLVPEIYNLKEKKIIFSNEVKDKIKFFAIIFLIGFLISLLFWFQPIFIFKGFTPNDIQNITTPDLSNAGYLWKTIFDSLTPLVLPYSSGILIIFSLINLFGLYYIAKNFKKLESKFMLVLILAWIFCSIHPLFTLPLFDLHLVNFMLVDQISRFTSLLVIAFGLLFLNEKISSKNWKILIFTALFLLAFSNYSDAWNQKEDNIWIQQGKLELFEPFVMLSDWTRENTNVNDVFLTTNEDGFMFNAICGRKILSYRRAHTSPYIDINQRMADQAIIVYGENDAKREELLEQYNVKYLLWTNRWVLNEFQFDENGQFIGFFDPLTILDNESNRKYWNANGVKYQLFTFPMDPAPRDGAPVYEQLVAIPYEFSLEPLNPNLYNHFKLVKIISYNGVDYFKIYKIKE
ncbi:MAG: hypothetical protein WC501_01105 [Candidatus Micrarchaeia archaeon]